jgi:hypothetical protein
MLSRITHETFFNFANMHLKLLVIRVAGEPNAEGKTFEVMTRIVWNLE